MSVNLFAVPVSLKDKDATLVSGVYVLYEKHFEHPGPKPGEKAGTILYNGYHFYVAPKSFKRSEVVKQKLTKIIFSMWTKEGDFKLEGKSHRLTVLKDKETHSTVEIKVD